MADFELEHEQLFRFPYHSVAVLEETYKSIAEPDDWRANPVIPYPMVAKETACRPGYVNPKTKRPQESSFQFSLFRDYPELSKALNRMPIEERTYHHAFSGLNWHLPLIEPILPYDVLLMIFSLKTMKFG